MNGGFLQQYDSPAEVFARPVNMFVASFVGSPAMSLVPLEASTQDGHTVLTGAEGWSLRLSDLNARKVKRATTNKIVLGRAPFDDPAEHEPDAGRRSRQGLYGRAYRRRDLRTGLLSGAVVNISVPAVSPSRPISRSGSPSTKSACISSTGPRKWRSRPNEADVLDDRGQAGEAQDHGDQALSRLGRHPEPDAGQGRDGPGHFGWGESGLSGREKAVTGAIEHFASS